jgi:hypothetical protein
MHEETEEYGDPRIESFDKDIPTFLKWSYVLVPIWGILIYVLYFNGSHGWLDRGYWRQLQNAAKTTYPIQQFDTPKDYKDKTSQW